MKLLLLKVLLQRRARDEGFTLPVVIAIGLIMILLGAVNILGAGEENLNALSDSQKNKALAIAEVGVARYRQLLDKNRMLTVYDSNDWSSVTNTCDISTTISDAADTTNWQTVSDGTNDIGQYRLVSYVYDIDGDLTTDNNAQFAPNDDQGNTDDLITFNDIPYDPSTGIGYNPRGVLTIKSRDTANANNVSEAQVQVEIPIRINENDMNNLSPALWIGDSSITNVGSGSNSLILDGDRDSSTNGTAADGNIVISKPANGGTPGCDNPSVTANNRTIYDPRPLPTIVLPPTDVTKINELNTIPNIGSDSLRYGQFRGDNNQLQPMLLLGAKEAVPANHFVWRTDANGFDYYFYSPLGDLTIADGQKLATDGQSRVVVYVDNRDINLNGNASLQAGSKLTRGYKSVGLQVYVNGSQDINIDPNGKTVTIKALVHAPDSTVNITGNGTVLIEGAMWVKNWNNTGGANVTIIPDNAGVSSDKAYQHYLGTDNRAAKPITNAPTDWEIQEVAEE